VCSGLEGWNAGSSRKPPLLGGGGPPQETAGSAGGDTTVRRSRLVERQRHLWRYTRFYAVRPTSHPGNPRRDSPMPVSCPQQRTGPGDPEPDSSLHSRASTSQTATCRQCCRSAAREPSRGTRPPRVRGGNARPLPNAGPGRPGRRRPRQGRPAGGPVAGTGQSDWRPCDLQPEASAWRRAWTRLGRLACAPGG
jgi:hypothetical protein